MTQVHKAHKAWPLLVAMGCDEIPLSSHRRLRMGQRLSSNTVAWGRA